MTGGALLAMGLCGGILAASTIAPTMSSAGQCREHIELLSAEKLAKEMGVTESWVVGKHKINLWEKPTSQGRGRVVGRLLPGSRAVILDHAEEDFKVRSPFDKSTGWVNTIQVQKLLWQDDKAFTPCAPKK